MDSNYMGLANGSESHQRSSVWSIIRRGGLLGLLLTLFTGLWGSRHLLGGSRHLLAALPDPWGTKATIAPYKFGKQQLTEAPASTEAPEPPHAGPAAYKDALPTVPRVGIEYVLVPEAHHVLPTGLKGVQCMFNYGPLRDDDEGQRFLKDGRADDAWVFGAKLYGFSGKGDLLPRGRQEGSWPFALPTHYRSNQDIIKGRLQCWDSLWYRLRPALWQERLKAADQLHGYDPSKPQQGLWRRSVVHCVKSNGDTWLAYWYYRNKVPVFPLEKDHTYPAQHVLSGDWLEYVPVPPSQISTTVGPTTQPATTKFKAPVPIKEKSVAVKDAWWERSVRLPEHVVPLHYHTYHRVDLEKFLFTGSIDIDVQITRETDAVVLHSNGLVLTAMPTLRHTDADKESATPVAGYLHYAKHQFLVLQLGKSVNPSPLTIHLDFMGNLTDNLVGFYRSQYRTQTGKMKWIATTQFEATDARRAFPCMDEPNRKANFSVRLDVPKGYHAISNMPEVQKIPFGEGRHEFVFAPSVKISTYLVAFVVSDFKHLETSYKSTDGTTKQLRVFAAPGKEEWGRLALETGAKMMQHYEKYFDIPFPLPKQDMVACPDFASGAMENWGLIIYRETALLFQEAEQGAVNKQRVIIVIAHEISHQWFGNLVTMDWWDGLWLNEGFASYMEYEGAAHVFPDWDMRTQFYDQTMSYALSFDGTTETHPVLQAVDNPEQIRELFDAISYRKGASLVRMMEGFLGTDVFLKGVSAYLKKYAFANAETDDLWAQMSIAYKKAHPKSDVDVIKIMDRWTTTEGYPLLEVKKDGDKYKLSQSRYWDTPIVDPAKKAQAERNLWDIPLTYRLAGDKAATPPSKRQIWMHHTQSEMTTDAFSGAEVFKLNADSTAFMRVLYPPEELAKLKEAIASQSPLLSRIDRASILSDAFSCFDSNKIGVSSVLGLVEAYQSEPLSSTTVWNVLAGKLGKIGSKLKRMPIYDTYKAFVAELIEKVVVEVGWATKDKEPHLNRMARSTLKGAGLTYEVKGQEDEAGNLFQMFLINPTDFAINPDIRAGVYNTVVKKNGKDAFEFMWDRYRNEANRAEANRALASMGAVEDKELMKEMLSYTIKPYEDGGIRAQDAISGILMIAGNKLGREITWKFIQDSWQPLFDNHGRSAFAFAALLEGVLSTFDSQALYDEAQTFFRGRDVGTGARALERGYAAIKANMEWNKNNLEELSSFLETWKKQRSKRRLLLA